MGTVLASSFDWGIPHNALLLAAVFFPFSITYALLQYNLFDMDAILNVGLTRGGLTALLLLIYVAVVFVLGIPFGSTITTLCCHFCFLFWLPFCLIPCCVGSRTLLAGMHTAANMIRLSCKCRLAFCYELY